MALQSVFLSPNLITGTNHGDTFNYTLSEELLMGGRRTRNGTSTQVTLRRKIQEVISFSCRPWMICVPGFRGCLFWFGVQTDYKCCSVYSPAAAEMPSRLIGILISADVDDDDDGTTTASRLGQLVVDSGQTCKRINHINVTIVRRGVIHSSKLKMISAPLGRT